MKTGKIVFLSTVCVLGVLAIIGGIIAYAVYPIEADRPADINPDLWFDTKDFYKQTVQEVDDTISGKKTPIYTDLPEWDKKYLSLVVDTSNEHPAEHELAKDMDNMRTDALLYMEAYFENKNHPSAQTENKLESAKERYEDAKKTVENILYVWK